MTLTSRVISTTKMAENSETPATKDANVVPLEDEKTAQEGQFVGATLEISGGENGPKTPDPETEVEFAGPGLSRNRPGSTIGRQSIRSTTSRCSMRPGVIKTDAAVDTFFSYKVRETEHGSSFEAAVDKCRPMIKPELDGELRGAWLLTEIDHWDLEHEKILMLCDWTLLVCKFNFITQKLMEFKRVMLHCVDTISIGDFKYPINSLMPDRQQGGVQLRWNRGQELSFGQKWNPFASDIPYITFSHHPILYNPKENETVTYNCDDFYDSLIQATSKAYESKRPNDKITIIEGPILIESYASLASMVYNQSGIGFCRDRNGVSF